jgi:hypothetical protein
MLNLPPAVLACAASVNGPALQNQNYDRRGRENRSPSILSRTTASGTTATITAKITPQIGGAPTGTVKYLNGSMMLGTAPVGVAFTTPVLPVGTNNLTAVYSGDANFLASSSPAAVVKGVAATH